MQFVFCWSGWIKTYIFQMCSMWTLQCFDATYNWCVWFMLHSRTGVIALLKHRLLDRWSRSGQIRADAPEPIIAISPFWKCVRVKPPSVLKFIRECYKNHLIEQDNLNSSSFYKTVSCKYQILNLFLIPIAIRPVLFKVGVFIHCRWWV